MFTTSAKANELRDLRALNAIAHLITLRECLRRLRDGRVEDAIGELEIAVDVSVSGLVGEIEGCDGKIRGLMEDELRRLAQYRQEFCGVAARHLADLDAETRTRLEAAHAEVESILKSYRHDNAA